MTHKENREVFSTALFCTNKLILNYSLSNDVGSQMSMEWMIQ